MICISLFWITLKKENMSKKTGPNLLVQHFKFMKRRAGRKNSYGEYQKKWPVVSSSSYTRLPCAIMRSTKKKSLLNFEWSSARVKQDCFLCLFSFFTLPMYAEPTHRTTSETIRECYQKVCNAACSVSN